MKKLILLVAFGVWCLPLTAGWTPAQLRQAKPPVASGGACATSDTTLPHSLFLEGFETPGYENSWAETGTVDDQADTSALTSNKPVGACDVGFSVSVSGSAKYATHDLGSHQAQPVDLYCYIYPTGITDGDLYSIIGFNANAPAGETHVNFRRAGSTYEVRVVADTVTAFQAINVDSWNLIQLHVEGASSYLKVNGGSEIAFTATAFTTRYISIGQLTASIANAGTWYFDLVAVD